jgi:hypothetical protein
MPVTAHDRLIEMRAIALGYTGSRSIGTLTRLARSRNARERLLALLLMQEENWRQRGTHFELARSMIGDVDNDCRWQALIVIGDYLESRTDDVWRVIDQYAEDADDDDMQTALFCILLEHLWELNKREYRKCARKLAKQHAWLRDCIDDDAFWFIRRSLPKSVTTLLKDLQNTANN